MGQAGDENEDAEYRKPKILVYHRDEVVSNIRLLAAFILKVGKLSLICNIFKAGVMTI